MRKLLTLIVIATIMSLNSYAQAATIFSEDFSDVSDWEILYDPAGGSTITSSGGLGAMYVDKGSTQAAFIPSENDANLTAFNPAKASKYTLYWDVDNLTDSVGWDVAIDEFDSNKKFINTIWNIYPEEGNCAETGRLSKNLSGFNWSTDTAYIKPKINVHTGYTQQTVYLNYIKIVYTSIP